METETKSPVDIIGKPRKRKAQEESATELQKVANVPSVVDAFGKKYTIKKFTLGQIAQALGYVGPLQYLIKTIVAHVEEHGRISNAQAIDLILPVLAQSTYSMIGLISVATGEPSEWIEEQDDTIGGIDILTTSVEKNADFFSPKNIERLKGMGGRLQAAIPALSGITSTPSSSTDTAP